MFPSNAHYGHRSILSDYAGVPNDRSIPGLVQHGWNHDLGATLIDIRLPLPNPFFAWAGRNVRRCHEAGLEHVVGLGAPFLYLPPAPKPPTRRPRSLVAVPVHGWEKERVQQEFGLYARSLAEIANDFDEITVCLYWFDHQFAENREPFEALGMKVVTAGHRDRNPDFPYSMRRLLLEHEYATSNRIQTGAFYAMHLGCRFFLRGPPVGLDGRIDHSGQLFDAWQEREFPSLLWDNFQGDVETEMAATELGAEFKRNPDELRELFLWQPAQRRELARRLQAQKTARSAGLGRLWHRGRRLVTSWWPTDGDPASARSEGRSK